MQAIILVGGKGTRLRSITGDNLPKPLIQLDNQTLLDYLIYHAKINGCNNIIVCTGYLGDQISEHIKKRDYGIPVLISQETKPLGTAGVLPLIKNDLEEIFFILYGDVYTTINLKKMLIFHKQKTSDVTLAVHTSDHPQDSTVVAIDKKSQVLQFIEKPGASWEQYGNLTTTPLYIVKKDVLHFIPRDAEVDFARDIFPKMLTEKKKLFGYATDEYAKDIGTPDRYNKVLRLLKK